MTQVYLLVFGSFGAGIVLASVWRLTRGRASALPAGPASRLTLTAGLIVLLGDLATRAMAATPLMPFDVPSALSWWYLDYRFTVPVVAGVLAVTLLALPVHARRGRCTAELTRRSLVSFARPWWFVPLGALLALVVLVTIVAGAASQPDSSTGRYMSYEVDVGGYTMGTNIYGWFYSVPAIVSVGVLLVVATVGMSFVARPALAEDRQADIRVRTARTRNIVAATTGVLLLLLGDICGSLAGTASLRSTFATSEGPVSFWTTFSALGPALIAASTLCTALGVALWAAVTLSGVPGRRRAPVTVGS
ncbi:hypothetical protein [Sanguibacter antarcticus]|uniref:Uncharacterized protein n=1 Tax=Sanguibacter antarcticus TaxID=372484 RepID=A0A2A9E711_9MICO|nr:hypothetical protein [Sanguibacter antarcticus]PFG34644.1 hypothetical protein ATL42_2561 [Sanguibacter antarcticus]